MNRRVFSNVMVIACLAVAAHTSRVAAQCLVETDAELDPPVTDLEATVRFKASGLISCPGLFQGFVCASGTLTGTCSHNTQTGTVITCQGRCTAEYGSTPSCNLGPGDQVSFAELSQECDYGVCRGTTSSGTCSASVADPASLLDRLESCADQGLTTSFSRGAVLLVCPQ